MTFRVLTFFLFVPLFYFAQKNDAFQASMTYEIEMMDTAAAEFFPPKLMQLYTNDTIVRVENTTDKLGKQVEIRHLKFNKAYLLIETAKGNYAIQSSFDTIPEESFKYSYEKKCFGKKKFAGRKAKRLLVSSPDWDEEKTFYYFRKIDAKYLRGFRKFPGLLAQYYVHTIDGTYRYTLTELEIHPISRDLFGIPSDFQRVSMDEFVDIMTGAKSTEN